ncbi:MAG: CoA-binding protein [Anaerolineae bacterium]
MPSMLEMKVNDFLAQKRIAVAGVSRKAEGAVGNSIYRRLRDASYQVFPVNPNASEVEGVTCYHTVKDIPEKVDGVVIVTRPPDTEKVVHDCADAGITRVWMHGGPHGPGTSVSQDAVQFCKEHNITVIAGACPLMYGKPSDGFHRFIRGAMGFFGKLPN